jgi:hypothetical protein
MTLKEIIEELDLTLLTEEKDFNEVIPSGGYASDMLSRVMGSAPSGGIWVTLQAHANAIAVASVMELKAVILTEGVALDPKAIAIANKENITLLSTQKSTFTVVGKLWEMGLRGG